MDGSFERRLAPIKTDVGSREEYCETHGNYITHGFRFTVGRGREIWTPCSDCEEARRAEALRAEAQERARREQLRLQAMLDQAGIPRRWHGLTLDSFRTELPQQARAHRIAATFAADFRAREQNGDSLIFAGGVGTGKTHLGVAVLQHLLPERVGVYTTFLGMVQAVRGTWRKSSGTSHAEVVGTLGRVPLLVLDEIGMQYGTEGEQVILFEILDLRYRDCRPTILITNQDRQGFRELVGERVDDRLREVGRWVPFDWQSYRRRSGGDWQPSVQGPEPSQP